MKKKSKSNIIISAITAIALIFGSCATHYVPNVINTPLFKESGETSLAVHTGISGVDPQFALALTDNIALMMNASFANREYEAEESSTIFKFHKHQFFEAAAGYFDVIGKNGVLEGFVGMGRGRTRAYDDTWGTWGSQSIDSRFTRIFIQPAIGISQDAIEGSASARMVMVRFDDRQIGTELFLEPALTGKFGNNWLKFVIQMGFSLQLVIDYNLIEYNPFILSVGLQLKPGNVNRQPNVYQ